MKQNEQLILRAREEAKLERALDIGIAVFDLLVRFALVCLGIYLIS